MQKTASTAPKLPEYLAQEPEPTPTKPGIHHNSPQRPKIVFIHNKVVRPQLLTFTWQGNGLEKIWRGKSQRKAQNKKPHPRKDGALIICRRSPNLPHTYACSTIGPTRLNFRVRDGNGCDPRSKLTGKLLKFRSRDLPQLNRLSRHLPKTY
jgi:hypothetical protein